MHQQSNFNSIIKGIQIFVITLISLPIFGQNLAKISGIVLDSTNTPLFSASIGIEGTSLGTVTNTEGNFTLYVPSDELITLQVYFLGYETYREQLNLKSGESSNLQVRLNPKQTVLEDVEVLGIQGRENTLIPINLKSFDQTPGTSGNIEDIIKTLPGVASGNELSSQYSVRGGSYDENLIYVNDIEVHRPLLIQSAQQEGLSFVNADMVSSIQFSAGGFSAEYGDKLSSVLDIRYKQPTTFGGSASASLMGGTAHIEGVSKNKKFSHLTGLRYKTTKYLLGSLETKGDYNPTFIDGQTYLTWKLNKKLDISFLGNYAINSFQRTPTERITNFGTLQNTMQFKVYYEGQEIDRFDSYMGAVSLNYHPSEKLNLKLIGSGFHSEEEITYDLLKQYYIDNLSQSSSGERDSLINIGIGSSLEHARNFLNSNIVSLAHKGTLFTDEGILKWGVKAQQEYISDAVSEWSILDSAGYALPFSYNYKWSNTFRNYRFSSYLQYTHRFITNAGEFNFTLGARSQYWTYNKELTVSPRGNITFAPYNFENITFHLASGIYHQPPFYKEIRNLDGTMYPDKKAQRSWHVVSGMDYNFKAWSRPFLFSTEIFYKQMTRVIPYKNDDVRLVYMPQYNAKAYAMGIDFRINGEFVSTEESWFSLSLLRTREDIYNDHLVNLDGTVTYPGYFRRPTDQWLNFTLFFQDHLPTNPNYKAHLLLSYATGLPYAGPGEEQPSITHKLGAYRRADIGFSRLITGKKNAYGKNRSLWISLEVLNLFGARNKVSYDWVRTVESTQGVDLYFAIPNYLTGRIFNLKITTNF